MVPDTELGLLLFSGSWPLGVRFVAHGRNCFHNLAPSLNLDNRGPVPLGFRCPDGFEARPVRRYTEKETRYDFQWPGGSEARPVRRYTENEARYVKGLLKEGGELHLRHAALLLQRWLAAGECKKGCSDTFYHLLAVRMQILWFKVLVFVTHKTLNPKWLSHCSSAVRAHIPSLHRHSSGRTFIFTGGRMCSPCECSSRPACVPCDRNGPLFWTRGSALLSLPGYAPILHFPNPGPEP